MLPQLHEVDIAREPVGLARPRSGGWPHGLAGPGSPRPQHDPHPADHRHGRRHGPPRPRPRPRPRQLRTVSVAHGTEAYRGDAPSVSQPPVADDGWAQAPALTYASAGFAAVAPDYLGLGVGPGPHPWMDVPSETTASLDMLRAA